MVLQVRICASCHSGFRSTGVCKGLCKACAGRDFLCSCVLFSCFVASNPRLAGGFQPHVSFESTVSCLAGFVGTILCWGPSVLYNSPGRGLAFVSCVRVPFFTPCYMGPCASCMYPCASCGSLFRQQGFSHMSEQHAPSLVAQGMGWLCSERCCVCVCVRHTEVKIPDRDERAPATSIFCRWLFCVCSISGHG